MNLNQLKDLDASLNIVQEAKVDNKFYGICDLKLLKKSYLLFIKDKKFYQKLEQLTDWQKLELNLVIDKKFYSQFENFPLMSFNWVATSEDMSLMMAKTSKINHDIVHGKVNDVVDGRQLGTASIHPTAWIAQGAFIGEHVEIGENVKIHPGAVILSNTKIGKNTEIFPNTTVYHRVQIGDNCRIHANCVIGGDGFGYNYKDGVHHKIWHVGGVVIGNNVEVGTLTNIDGGTFSPTIVGDGTIIDSQVQVAHNCKLGRGVVLCGQVAIGGSTEIGDFTVLGGKSGTGHDLKIGRGVQIGGGALVNCDWEDGAIVSGYPARPLKEWLRGLAYLRLQSQKK